MKSIFIVTMWSGGRAAKKWKTLERPESLPAGTGVRFTSIDTKLVVEVIGSVSVEEFESGREELAAAYWENPYPPDEHPAGPPPPPPDNVEKLF